MEYARVVNGIVMELFTPPGNVPISDCFCQEIASQFVPTNGAAVKNNYVYSNGTFSAPAPVVLTLAQNAANAATGGLTITLSGTMTLAATLFPTDTKTQKAIESMNAMARAGVLPLGSTTYPMIDASEKWHHFTAAQYQAVAGAIAAYVAACDLIAAGNPLGVSALPQNSVALTV